MRLGWFVVVLSGCFSGTTVLGIGIVLFHNIDLIGVLLIIFGGIGWIFNQLIILPTLEKTGILDKELQSVSNGSRK